LLACYGELILELALTLSKICFIHIAASVINEVTHRTFNIICNIVVLLWQS